MKKMSEVFELPLVVEFVGGTDFHVKNKSRKSPAIYSNSADEAFSAAHAINHVDALAEALCEAIEELELFNSAPEMNCSLSVFIEEAKAALKAYRGEK